MHAADKQQKTKSKKHIKHFQEYEDASVDNSPIGLIFEKNNDNSVSSIHGVSSKTSKKRIEKRMKELTYRKSATQFRQKERKDGSRVGGYLSSSSGSDDENRNVGKHDSFKTNPMNYGHKKS